jgi:hypothetical protein
MLMMRMLHVLAMSAGEYDCFFESLVGMAEQGSIYSS